MIDRCPECGAVVVRKSIELYCSKCGLVIGEDYEKSYLPPPKPSKTGSTSHNLSRRDLRYRTEKEATLDKLRFYVSLYLDGYPKNAKERALA